MPDSRPPESPVLGQPLRTRLVDFNGDLSQDIALIVKPASNKLPEINGEFQPRILRDLLAPIGPTVARLHVDQDVESNEKAGTLSHLSLARYRDVCCQRDSVCG